MLWPSRRHVRVCKKTSPTQSAVGFSKALVRGQAGTHSTSNVHEVEGWPAVAASPGCVELSDLQHLIGEGWWRNMMSHGFDEMLHDFDIVNLIAYFIDSLRLIFPAFIKLRWKLASMMLASEWQNCRRSRLRAKAGRTPREATLCWASLARMAILQKVPKIKDMVMFEKEWEIMIIYCRYIIIQQGLNLHRLEKWRNCLANFEFVTRRMAYSIPPCCMICTRHVVCTSNSWQAVVILGMVLPDPSLAAWNYGRLQAYNCLGLNLDNWMRWAFRVSRLLAESLLKTNSNRWASQLVKLQHVYDSKLFFVLVRGPRADRKRMEGTHGKCKACELVRRPFQEGCGWRGC